MPPIRNTASRKALGDAPPRGLKSSVRCLHATSRSEPVLLGRPPIQDRARIPERPAPRPDRRFWTRARPPPSPCATPAAANRAPRRTWGISPGDPVVDRALGHPQHLFQIRDPEDARLDAAAERREGGVVLGHTRIPSTSGNWPVHVHGFHGVTTRANLFSGWLTMFAGCSESCAGSRTRGGDCDRVGAWRRRRGRRCGNG